MDMKTSPSMTGFGITSIAVVFTVLCFTIFSVLSLSTAAFEKKLSDKSAQAVKNYYAADLACSQTASAFKQLWQADASLQTVKEYAALAGARCVKDETGVLVSFSSTIDQEQTLFVLLHLGKQFSIEQWQVVSTSDWQPDESIDLWSGAFE